MNIKQAVNELVEKEGLNGKSILAGITIGVEIVKTLIRIIETEEELLHAFIRLNREISKELEEYE